MKSRHDGACKAFICSVALADYIWHHMIANIEPPLVQLRILTGELLSSSIGLLVFLPDIWYPAFTNQWIFFFFILFLPAPMKSWLTHWQLSSFLMWMFYKKISLVYLFKMCFVNLSFQPCTVVHWQVYHWIDVFITQWFYLSKRSISIIVLSQFCLVHCQWQPCQRSDMFWNNPLNGISSARCPVQYWSQCSSTRGCSECVDCVRLGSELDRVGQTQIAAKANERQRQTALWRTVIKHHRRTSGSGLLLSRDLPFSVAWSEFSPHSFSDLQFMSRMLEF